jgi:hypothetical protein
MGYANSAEIAMAGMGSGRADDAFSFGSRPDKWRAGGCEGAGLVWDEAAVDEFRAWI